MVVDLAASGLFTTKEIARYTAAEAAINCRPTKPAVLPSSADADRRRRRIRARLGSRPPCVPHGGPLAAVKSKRRAIAFAESATPAERLEKVFYDDGYQRAGELLDNSLADLRENHVLNESGVVRDPAFSHKHIIVKCGVPFGPLATGSVEHLRLVKDRIIERAMHSALHVMAAGYRRRTGHSGSNTAATANGSITAPRPARRAPGCSTVLRAGRRACSLPAISVVEVQGPVPHREGRWLVANIGAESGHDISVHADKLFLVMTNDEREELLQESDVHLGGGEASERP
ncbi:hypothetical protein BDK51DRAFT_43129 [Blyttiomyces helicus]|uniref:Uncharacterized protein n=1 Tax=Blyttiomyces helicus TaxID=388810 RepID=A0A4P9WP85_9FUNG|nr:hypothetical protein BDK51DRAFT_43129 [Blyttiomyces helicus]|eukprot:RKO93040.1 hypothetical protein BDK51DRAFT_43129 [Blyttiomyces helicus]